MIHGELMHPMEKNKQVRNLANSFKIKVYFYKYTKKDYDFSVYIYYKQIKLNRDRLLQHLKPKVRHQYQMMYRIQKQIEINRLEITLLTINCLITGYTATQMKIKIILVCLSRPCKIQGNIQVGPSIILSPFFITLALDYYLDTL